MIIAVSGSYFARPSSIKHESDSIHGHLQGKRKCDQQIPVLPPKKLKPKNVSRSCV